MKISKEYSYVQAKVYDEILDDLSLLSSSTSSSPEKREVYLDIEDYCDYGETDPRVEEIISKKKISV